MFAWYLNLKDLLTAWGAPFLRYERHISAAAMLGGFTVDNFAFGRIDRPAANLVFCGYLALAAGTIALVHWLQSWEDNRAARIAANRERYLASLPPAQQMLMREAFSRHDAALQQKTEQSGDMAGPDAEGAAAEPSAPAPKDEVRNLWLDWTPFATQFALGGLWSGFLVFYSRSAVFTTSWPFLLILTAALFGNEIFRKYHSRLVFTALLLFFALYSYAIFVVPIFTRSIGPVEFLISGAAATLIYLLFLRLLRGIGRARYQQSRLALVGGVVGILAAMNILYFADILPPLPLALADAGVYHSAKRNGDVYEVMGEDQPWSVRVGLEPPVMHVTDGERLYVFGAVFAPISLATRITHSWQWYDSKARRWRTKSTVTYPINGGREGGYRGYTIKSQPDPGEWRVDIETIDGRLIGRIKFMVETVSEPAPLVSRTLH